MTHSHSTPMVKRRALLFGVAASCWGGASLAQAVKSQARTPELVQIVDTSNLQRDVTKDFVAGCRAAFSEAKQRGGRVPLHTLIETDGSAGQLRSATTQALATTHCVALMGSVGNPAANWVASSLRDSDTNIAHCAPWLQTGVDRADARHFLAFASRSVQISHALRAMSVTGVREVGAVFSNLADQNQHLREMQVIADTEKLRLQAYTFNGDLRSMGAKLGSDSPAMLVFFGGTPELIEFTSGMQRQDRQRFVIGLSDVNLQVYHQVVKKTSAAVIATQPVPLVTSSIAVVRDYRQALALYFDEPPTPQSLAGYIAARYTLDSLRQAESANDRDAVVSAMTKRARFDVGGFSAGFNTVAIHPSFVTQSMLTADGRVIG